MKDETRFRYNIMVDQFGIGGVLERSIQIETKTFPEPLQHGDNVTIYTEDHEQVYVGDVYKRIPTGVNNDTAWCRITTVHTKIEHIDMDKLKEQVNGQDRRIPR
jgi:hypothetical protein